jgi:hypothetical protein
MATKGILDLFGYVLDGIRGAGNRGERLRAKHEIDLAMRMLMALQAAKPSVEFSRAIEEYKIHAEGENNEVMKLCAYRYEKLIRNSDHVTFNELEQVKTPYYEALCEILRIGLTFMQAALREENFLRIEIEADHLHNVPTYLTLDTNRNLDYFRQMEHPYYLDRIEQTFGIQQRVHAEVTYAPHWKFILN